MDLSKIPRSSHSQERQSPQSGGTELPAQPPALPALEYEPRQSESERGVGPEMFINVVIGALVIYLAGWPVIDYLIHLTTGRNFNYPVTDASGPVPYLRSPIFWQNLGALHFGVALILYGILGRSGAALAWAVLALLWVSAAINAVAVVLSLGVTAFPLISALAGAFSIYLAMYQWARVKLLAGAR